MFLRSSLFPLTTFGCRSMSLQQPTRVRPTDWKAAAPEPLPNLTFRSQSKLPKLPVPDLTNTLLRLKNSLKPIARSDDEYTRVLKRIDDFATNQGPILQSRLLERAKHRSHWLEEWWDESGYLGYRDSVRENAISSPFSKTCIQVVVNVSYYCATSLIATGKTANLLGLNRWLRRPSTSSITEPCLSSCWYNQSRHDLSPTTETGSHHARNHERGSFVYGYISVRSIHNFILRHLPLKFHRWMFDCCRVPGEGLDWSISYSKPGDLGDSGHIIAIRRNRLWKIDVSRNGGILSTQEIEKSA